MAHWSVAEPLGPGDEGAWERALGADRLPTGAGRLDRVTA